MKSIINIRERKRKPEIFPCFRVNGWGQPLLIINEQKSILFEENDYKVYRNREYTLSTKKSVEKVRLDAYYINSKVLSVRNLFFHTKSPILFLADSSSKLPFLFAIYFPELEMFLVVYKDVGKSFEVCSSDNFSQKFQDYFSHFSLDFTLKIDILRA